MTGFYHLSVQMIGRSEGRSAVACAAYRSGQVLEDNRYAKTHDYSARRGIVLTDILTPEDAPNWAHDREALWNNVEAAEKRKDAQLAREFTLGLPHQVELDVRAALVREFIAEQLTPRGMIVDFAIHAPGREGDNRNWHAHIMTTLRPLEEGKLAANKDREACKREMIQQWREAWAEIQNRTFERLQVRDTDGSILRVDHRSYEDQGIDLEPMQHMGVLAMAMEREGIQTEIGDRNREIIAANQNRNLVRRQVQHATRDKIRHQFAPPEPDIVRPLPWQEGTARLTRPRKREGPRFDR